MKNMNYIFIGLVFMFGLILILNFKKNKSSQNTAKNKAEFKTGKQLKDNDKIIVIENVDYSLIKQAIIDFTKNYDNPQQYNIKPISKIWKVSNSKVIITFPYDIDFEIFCYYVNYLKYPVDINYSPRIQAWTTTKSTDNWLNKDFENKKIIMFLDPNDKEFDNVMITTEDNIPYKICFEVGYGLRKEKMIIYKYSDNNIDINNIENISNEMIK